MEAPNDKSTSISLALPAGDVEKGTDLVSLSTVRLGQTQTGVDTAGFSRSLSKRQIIMMVFAAGIGTGLWVGTGQALQFAGPGGIAVGYSLITIIVWNLYMSIGEMTTYRPVHGGFLRQTADYVDPALGFAEGINFWFSWLMIIPAEITAAVSVLKFWPAASNFPLAAYISIFLVCTALPNILHVKWYGKIEYVFSWIKLLGIIIMLFYLFIMASGGVPATGGPLVFHYWKTPGAFNNGMKGLAKAFTQAAFSFGGAQQIAVMAGEARNPRKTVPSLVYPLFWRVFTFFVFNIWILGMCVPSDDARLSSSGTLGSPFVIALERGNLMIFANVINAFIFITVVSCGITSFYISSRTLCAMSDTKLIHPIFGRKDSAGRPWVSLIICTVLGGGLCYLNLNNTAVQVYNWFSSLVAVATFNQYLTIIVTHLCFRRAITAQGIGLNNLPFKALFAPYGQYIAAVITLFVMACEFYIAIYPIEGAPSAKNFFSVELALPLFFLDYFGYKWWFGTKIKGPMDIDFSEAKIFDEEDRIVAEREASDGTIKEKKRFDPVQIVKNLIFG